MRDSIKPINDAFVYCWTDTKNNMLYIGYHRGTTDDGYVCSSKWMKFEFSERPQDFHRQIICKGTKVDCVSFEATLLKAVNAKRNPDFYNMTNGDKNFVLKKGTHKSVKWTAKQRARKSQATSGERNPFYGKHHTESTRNKISKMRKSLVGVIKRTEESKHKMSIIMKGRPSPRRGCTLTEEDKKHKSEAAYEVWRKRKQDPQWRTKMNYKKHHVRRNKEES